MSLTAEKIRKLIKDESDLNILLEHTLQSGDPLIESAIEMAVSDFNALPPIGTNYSAANIPSISILFHGVLYYLMNSEAQRQLRNQVTYTAQGLSAPLDDKFQQYLHLAQFYKQLFESHASRLKQAINMSNAWGHISSPYVNINENEYS